MTFSKLAHDKVISRVEIWLPYTGTHSHLTLDWAIQNALMDGYYFFPIEKQKTNFSYKKLKHLQFLYYTEENYKAILFSALTEKKSKVIKIV